MAAAAAKPNVVAGRDYAQYCPEFPLRMASLGERVSGRVECVVCRKVDPSVPNALGSVLTARIGLTELLFVPKYSSGLASVCIGAASPNM